MGTYHNLTERLRELDESRAPPSELTPRPALTSATDRAPWHRRAWLRSSLTASCCTGVHGCARAWAGAAVEAQATRLKSASAGQLKQLAATQLRRLTVGEEQYTCSLAELGVDGGATGLLSPTAQLAGSVGRRSRSPPVPDGLPVLVASLFEDLKRVVGARFPPATESVGAMWRRELLAHLAYGREQTLGFVGRKALLDQLLGAALDAAKASVRGGSLEAYLDALVVGRERVQALRAALLVPLE